MISVIKYEKNKQTFWWKYFLGLMFFLRNIILCLYLITMKYVQYSP